MLRASLYRGSRALEMAARTAVRAYSIRAPEVRTLVDMQLRSCEMYADRELFGTRVPLQLQSAVDTTVQDENQEAARQAEAKGDAPARPPAPPGLATGKPPPPPPPGEWVFNTYAQYGAEVHQLRAALRKLGVGVNDRVALISNNRAEWPVVAYATYGVGAQIVPMYEAQLAKDWRYITKDSGAKVVIASKELIYNQIANFAGSLGQVEHVLCMDADASEPHSLRYHMNEESADTEAGAAEKLDEHHLAGIMYTSGTTGNPKGVQLSHRNLWGQIWGIERHWQQSVVDETHRSLCFLPWAHCYGQTCELNMLLAHGSSIAIVPDVTMILPCFQEVKPTVLMTVPVLLKRIYDGAMTKVGEASPLKQKIFFNALAAGRAKWTSEQQGTPYGFLDRMRHKFYDKLVLSKVRETLGGRVEFMTLGGAATPIKVLEFMHDIGIPIMEGYGLTETSPMITVNSPDPSMHRVGTCGAPLYGMEVKIVWEGEEVPLGEEGEVWAAGQSVMGGYHDLPEETAAAFGYLGDKKYFRTGDIGKLQEGKFLRITGRIKEQYKLENGKYVVPAGIEEHIIHSRYIFQTTVYGDNRPYNVALIVPEFVLLTAFLKEQGVTHAEDMPIVEILQHPKVVSLINDELLKANRNIKKFEQPRKWAFLEEPFTQQNHMLTAKMSIRRRNVFKTHAALLDSMYAGTAGYDLAEE